MARTRTLPAARRALGTVRRSVATRVRSSMRPGVGILAYHRVGRPAFDPWNLAVSEGHFEAQMASLRESFDVVSLEQAAGLLRRRPARRRAISVTFDDGYADTLSAALPILRRHDIPATVFVTTQMLGRGSFWWDDLDVAVLSHSIPVDEICHRAAELGLTAPAGSSHDRPGVHAALHAELRTMDPRRVEPIVGELLASVGATGSPTSGRPLTPHELDELASDPLISIGVHTAHHWRLPNLAPEDVRRELVDAADELDRRLGPARRALAYPYGDADDATVAIARSMGFTCAVTTANRWLWRGDDRFRMPRLLPTDVAAPGFTRFLGSQA